MEANLIQYLHPQSNQTTWVVFWYCLDCYTQNQSDRFELKEQAEDYLKQIKAFGCITCRLSVERSLD